jgi:hypothetical protein
MGYKLTGAKQQNLIITSSNESEITVDNIEVAQFVYLLLHNEKIRDVIDTITMGTLSRSISKTARPGQYGIVGPAFLYTDRDGRRVTTMFGYPTRKLALMGATGAGWGRNAVQLLSRARAKISNIFGYD